MPKQTKLSVRGHGALDCLPGLTIEYLT